MNKIDNNTVLIKLIRINKVVQTTVDTVNEYPFLSHGGSHGPVPGSGTNPACGTEVRSQNDHKTINIEHVTNTYSSIENSWKR